MANEEFATTDAEKGKQGLVLTLPGGVIAVVYIALADYLSEANSLLEFKMI